MDLICSTEKNEHQSCTYRCLTWILCARQNWDQWEFKKKQHVFYILITLSMDPCSGHTITYNVGDVCKPPRNRWTNITKNEEMQMLKAKPGEEQVTDAPVRI